MAFSSVKIESLLGMITVKLREDNFVKWDYQFQSVLKGYDFFDFFSGESQCPPKYIINTETGVTKEITIEYKEWVKTDVSLLSLLIATLSDEAMDYVIGCKTSQEAWTSLQERYASVSVVRVNQLKTEFHTAQKGADSVDKYLLRLKAIKDQLVVAGEKITDNDLVKAALSGLPPKFEMIRIVILARDTPISLKDFRAQLLGAEGSIESKLNTLSNSMSAMAVQGSSSGSQSFQGGYQGYDQGESSNTQGNTNYRASISPECQICSRRGHTALNCFFRIDSGQPSGGFIVGQICGKKGHMAFECYHRNNVSYQGAPPNLDHGVA